MSQLRPPQAPTHLWLLPGLRVQASGWGKGEEGSLRTDNAAGGPLPSSPHPVPPPAGSARGGGGVLAAPAGRGADPELTCPEPSPEAQVVPDARRGLRARLRGWRGGRGRSLNTGGGGGSAAGLIHRRRRETAQPGRRAAVFLLVQPPLPPNPRAGAPGSLAGTRRADGGCVGRIGGGGLLMTTLSTRACGSRGGGRNPKLPPRLMGGGGAADPACCRPFGEPLSRLPTMNEMTTMTTTAAHCTVERFLGARP